MLMLRQSALAKHLTGGLIVLLLSINPATKVNANATTLLPFFDQVNNPVPVGFPRAKNVDITPSPPQLSAFDRSVLQTCGEIGSRVKPESFKKLLSNYPNVLEKLQQVTGGEIYAGRRSKNQFLEDLTAIWFNRQGFEHIFCGEIEAANKIGGLHFFGRYWQLQQAGIGGRLPNNSQHEEVIPGVVYTMGVVIRQGDRVVIDDLKGYVYVSDAEELLLETTKAFKLQANALVKCIYPVRDRNSGKSYSAVFIKERDGIVTFYSDATPRGSSCRI